MVVAAGQNLFLFPILAKNRPYSSDRFFLFPSEIVPRDLRMKDKFLKHLTGMS